MDVVTAFLDLDAKKEIYNQVPEGMELPKEFLHLKDRRLIVLCLLKKLYGLNQAPKLWNDWANATLTS
jgi:hypothetical protein